jgi:hypothetical protein
VLMRMIQKREPYRRVLKVSLYFTVQTIRCSASRKGELQRTMHLSQLRHELTMIVHISTCKVRPDGGWQA